MSSSWPNGRRSRQEIRSVPGGRLQAHGRPGVRCNLCGSSKFADIGPRVNARCVACGSYERTRVIKLMLDHHGLLKPGARVLHFAPESGLANCISRVVGDGYDARDIDTERYRHIGVTRFDLVEEAHTLPDSHYDLVIHSHVLEHLHCDVTTVLFHLHRALAPSGTHIMSVPILSGAYEESLAPLSDEERQRRFGQFDHVRRWGADDIHRTLGMLFRLPETYDLEASFSPGDLSAANVPEVARRGFTGHSVFLLRKNDIRLVSSA